MIKPNKEKYTNGAVENTNACNNRNPKPSKRDPKIEENILSDDLMIILHTIPINKVVPKNIPFKAKYNDKIESFKDLFE